LKLKRRRFNLRKKDHWKITSLSSDLKKLKVWHKKSTEYVKLKVKGWDDQNVILDLTNKKRRKALKRYRVYLRIKNISCTKHYSKWRTRK